MLLKTRSWEKGNYKGTDGKLEDNVWGGMRLATFSMKEIYKDHRGAAGERCVKAVIYENFVVCWEQE